jgi:L-2-hydroxycarboxylate dehydrogenase (NAD+)
MRIPIQDAKKNVARILRAEGVPSENASMASDVIIQADVFGVKTHGLSRLGYYIKRLRDGIILPDAKIWITRKFPTCCVMDGGNCLGQVVANRATDIVMESAKEYGIGACAVRNSSHYGIAGYYSWRCAKQGLVGISFTNARPAVAPTFGNVPKLGTNPFAISMPSDFGFPFHIDCATSSIQRGNLEVLARMQQDADLSAYVTCAGKTPSQILDMIEAGTCALKPIGEHKGYGLSMAIELFSSAFQNGAFLSGLEGYYEGGEKKPYDVGHFFMCINPEAFTELEEFKRNVGNVMRELKASGHQVLVPGELESIADAEANQSGIEISDELLWELVSFGWDD